MAQTREREEVLTLEEVMGVLPEEVVVDLKAGVVIRVAGKVFERQAKENKENGDKLLGPALETLYTLTMKKSVRVGEAVASLIESSNTRLDKDKLKVALVTAGVSADLVAKAIEEATTVTPYTAVRVV